MIITQNNKYMNTIITLMLVWAISTLLVKKQIFEEDIPNWVSILRFALSPLLLIFTVIDWIIIGVKSSLRD